MRVCGREFVSECGSECVCSSVVASGFLGLRLGGVNRLGVRLVLPVVLSPFVLGE